MYNHELLRMNYTNGLKQYSPQLMVMAVVPKITGEEITARYSGPDLLPGKGLNKSGCYHFNKRQVNTFLHVYSSEQVYSKAAEKYSRQNESRNRLYNYQSVPNYIACGFDISKKYGSTYGKSLQKNKLENYAYAYIGDERTGIQH